MKRVVIVAALAVTILSGADAAVPARSRPDRAVAAYFGNSLIIRNNKGEIFQIHLYKPDRTFRFWLGGSWREGTWFTNNGQDNTLLCATHGPPVQTNCHPVRAGAKLGDRWRPGQPLRLNGQRATFNTPEAIAAGSKLYWAELVQGIVAPPDRSIPFEGPIEVKPPVRLGESLIQPFFGNTLVMRDARNRVVERFSYKPDHSAAHWRSVDGKARPASWVTNTGQEGDLLCVTDDPDTAPVTSCHFERMHTLGERWPADRAGWTITLEPGGGSSVAQ